MFDRVNVSRRECDKTRERDIHFKGSRRKGYNIRCRNNDVLFVRKC